MSHSLRRTLISIPAIATIALTACALPAGAGATAGTITECSAETQLRADVAAGGSYTFACSGTIALTSALLVNQSVSLTAVAPNVVTIEGYGSPPPPGTGVVDRIFTVASGGALELTGVHLAHGLVTAAPVRTPALGHSGISGCFASYVGWEGGACGPNAPSPTNYGEAGFSATAPGRDGGNAPAGGAALGGCILIEAGASATLVGDTLSECAAEGSSQKWLPGTGPSPGTEGLPGYEQGIGGFGGEGGNASAGFAGGDTYIDATHPAANAGGAGGDATNGANGGNGSAGGAALGGAIYDAGSLTLSETTFIGDRAIGGQGGAGGNGGRGGNGGAGGHGGTEFRYETGFPDGLGASFPGGTGGNGSYGGDGGDGGQGGAGEGGAVFALGYLTIGDSKFEADLARGGSGGTAGLGGEGGQGGIGGKSGGLGGGNDTEAISGGNGGNGGLGGSAGVSGNGGNGAGGAVYYATGSTGALPDAATAFTSDVVDAGSICAGLGSTPTDCGTLAGPGGSAGPGGESTPCNNPQAEKECGQAPDGTTGTAGGAGTIGVAGISEAVDVAGAPGSGSPPTKTSGGGGSAGGGSSGGGSSSGSGSPSGGATSAPEPHAGSASATGNSVKASVSCTGAAGQSCTFTATITAQETLRGGKLVAVASSKRKRSSVRHVTVVLGTATVTVAAGATRELTVELSALGQHLLSSRHSLPVRFTVSSATAGTYTATHLLDQTPLTLHAARAKHKR